MNKYEIIPSIIVSKLKIGKNDTILITVDIDKYDAETAYQMFKIMNKSFPENKVVLTFKGIDVEKI
jgi:hypothetical protein